jgi:hypothetical protein
MTLERQLALAASWHLTLERPKLTLERHRALGNL